MAKADSSASVKLDFSKRKITVMGTEVEATADGVVLTGDTGKDMKQTPALIAFWSNAHGSAVREEMLADARYRHWRAKEELKIRAGKGGKGEKAPNADTIKATVESAEEFLKFKDAMSKAAENVAITRGYVLALEKRSNLLQSTGATARVELEKLGVATPAETTGKRGKAGKGAKAADPTPDIEEEEDEDDDDFEEDEDEETRAEADESEEDEDDDEDSDDDEDEEEKSKGKKGGKGAKGKAAAEEVDDDDDDEEEAEEVDDDDDEDSDSESDDDDDDDDDEEDEDSDDDEDDEPPPPRRAKKAGKKKVAKKKTRKG